MHGTTRNVRPSGGFSGTAAQEQLEPAWQYWLGLLDRALEAAADPSWAVGIPESAPGNDPGTPLMHGAELQVNVPQLRRLIRDLLKQAAGSDGSAATLTGLKSRRLDMLEMVRAAIVGDQEAILTIAGDARADADALTVVAQMAAIPLMHGCWQKFRARVPDKSGRGYCPVCGAWPALAEMRGLEKSRRLRCGRCAADWALAVLQCPFCLELDHEQLRTLLPEGEEQHRRVDVCNSCRGYIKTFTGLRPMSLREMATKDLASIELDLIAQERGFARPSAPAFPLEVTLVRATGTGRPAGRASTEAVRS